MNIFDRRNVEEGELPLLIPVFSTRVCFLNCVSLTAEAMGPFPELTGSVAAMARHMQYYPIFLTVQ